MIHAAALSKRFRPFLFWGLGVVLLVQMMTSAALALSNFSPADGQTPKVGELTYGASTQLDVVRALGLRPDNVVKGDWMYPVIENYYFHENHDLNAAASLFVFQDGVLMGFYYVSPDKAMMDLTYMLQDNGDRTYGLNNGNGYMSYFSTLPYYQGTPQYYVPFTGAR